MMELYKQNLDVTELVGWVERQRVMMFPALLYLFVRATEEGEGRLLYPCYTVLDEKNGGSSWLFNASRGSFDDFYREYVSGWHRFSESGETVQKLPSPEECLYVSCLEAWGLREEFAKDGLFLALGKLFEDGGCFYIPLTIKNAVRPADLFGQLQDLCRECGGKGM